MIAVEEGAPLQALLNGRAPSFFHTANPTKPKQMRNKQQLSRALSLSALLLILTVTALPQTSCSGDEPLRAGYFISVGTKSGKGGFIGREEKVYIIIGAMQDSIRAVYPKPTKDGDDNAVLVACNNVYRLFRQEHPEYFSGYAMIRLHRGWMKDDVIKSSSVIMTWTF